MADSSILIVNQTLFLTLYNRRSKFKENIFELFRNEQLKTGWSDKMDCPYQSDKRSTQFLQSFWRVNRNLMQFAHKTALENDLSIPQYSVLMTIAPHKEMTQKQIGEILQIPKSTLSQAVDGLVQTEWIHRQPVQDNRREMQLMLSEKGIALCKKISLQKGSIHRTIDLLMDELPENKYEELQSTLLYIADFLEEEINKKEEIQNA